MPVLLDLFPQGQRGGGMSGLAKTAAALSPAQRKAILGAEEGFACHEQWLFFAPSWVAVHKLASLNIAYQLFDGRKIMELLPEGIELRCHLLKQEK
jgi:hypothetical protein